MTQSEQSADRLMAELLYAISAYASKNGTSDWFIRKVQMIALASMEP